MAVLVVGLVLTLLKSTRPKARKIVDASIICSFVLMILLGASVAGLWLATRLNGTLANPHVRYVLEDTSPIGCRERLYSTAVATGWRSRDPAAPGVRSGSAGPL